MNFQYLFLVIMVISLRNESAHCFFVNATSMESEETDECHMNGKQLSEIPFGNSSIIVLDLAYNNLANLPANIFQNKSYKELKILDLHENRINNVSSLAFRGLRKLKNIDLSFNKLNEFDTPYTFEQNRRLEKLDLTSNRISFKKTEVFLVSNSLQTLIVSRNDIEEIYEFTFVGMKHLTNLILDHNEKLNKIHIRAFRSLNDLQFLSLDNTGIVKLTGSMFAHLPRIINLNDTPLSKKFDPPLTRIKKNQIVDLFKMDEY